MKKKFTVYSLQFTVLIAFFLLLLLSPITYNLQPTFAQSPACQNNNRSEGLISTQTLSGKFGNQIPACIVGTPVVFTPFKIPTYDDLKSLYFTQARATGTPPPVQSVEIHYKACATLGGNPGNQVKSSLANSGGTFKAGNLTSLTNQCPTYQEFTDTFTTNPSGGAWTSADVNDLQIGIENQGGGGDDRRLTKIWAVVNYASSNEVLTPTAESAVAGKNDWILGAGASKTSATTSDDGDTSYLKRGAIWGGDPSPHYQWFEVSNLTGAIINKTETTPPPGGYIAEDYISSSIAAGYNVINIKGDLRLHGDISAPAKPVIVFVDSNILINLSNSGYQLTYGNTDAGIVFIAKGNIDIDVNVKRIDAVLIAEGAICTAFNGTNCPAGNVNSDPLLINGSLISLNESYPIQFKRNLVGILNNSTPAERIHHESKYLVILKDLFADTYQKWSEIQ